MKMTRAAALACLSILVGPTYADVVTIEPERDNSMYSENGSASAGDFPHIFAGVAANGGRRRALLHFDVGAAVPAGSTIVSASLTMTVTMTQTGSQPYDLHSLLADWGEGDSIAFGMGGAGGFAEAGDATWLHRFFPNDFWNTSGGEFDPTPSATASPALVGTTVTWSSSSMAGDVQGWLDDPSSNFGWLVRHSNEAISATAKRFGSRENFDVNQRPRLEVDFRPPGGASCVTSNFCAAVANSTGMPASMSASGSCSISAANLTLQAAPVPNTFFVFLQGKSRVQLPFGDGFRCIDDGLRRFSSTGVSSGNVASITIDPATEGILFPSVRRVQCYYGDPAAGGAGFNLSDALEITMVP